MVDIDWDDFTGVGSEWQYGSLFSTGLPWKYPVLFLMIAGPLLGAVAGPDGGGGEGFFSLSFSLSSGGDGHCRRDSFCWILIINKRQDHPVCREFELYTIRCKASGEMNCSSLTMERESCTCGGREYVLHVDAP
jgi:hypothetical protein